MARLQAELERRKAYTKIDPTRPNVKQIDLDIAGFPAIGRKNLLDATYVSAADAQTYLAGQTTMSHDRGHGTQISYTAPDNKVYLWYPGNNIILKGEWKVEVRYIEYIEGGQIISRKERSFICFKYGPNTYNPVTMHRGDGWECGDTKRWMENDVEQRAGDVFGLARRLKPPFILEREKTSIDAIRARL